MFPYIYFFFHHLFLPNIYSQVVIKVFNQAQHLQKNQSLSFFSNILTRFASCFLFRFGFYLYLYHYFSLSVHSESRSLEFHNIDSSSNTMFYILSFPNKKKKKKKTLLHVLSAVSSLYSFLYRYFLSFRSFRAD